MILKSKKPNSNSKIKVISLEEKKVLFSEGDASESMYVIKSGSLVIKKVKSEQEITLSTLGPNQIIGEMGFFNNEPRTATAQALTDSKLIEFPYSALHKEFKNLPKWVKILIQTIQFRLKKTNESILSLNEKLKLDENKEKPLFKKSDLQVIQLIDLISQSYHSVKENQTASFSIDTLKDVIFIYNFKLHQLKKILKSLEEINLIKVENQTKDTYDLKVLDLKALRNVTHWFKDQYSMPSENQFILIEEDLALIEKIFLFAEKSNPDFKTLDSITLDQFPCTPKELRRVEFLNEKGFLSLEGKEEENHDEDEIKQDSSQEKSEKNIVVEFFPLRLEKIFSFWKVTYALKKNEEQKENVSFP